MADNFIQLPPDSTGKKSRTFSHVVGPDTVHTQASTLVDQTGVGMGPFVAGRVDVNIGAAGVTVPVSDAGGSLTVDSPQLPAALVSGRLDVNIGASATITTTESRLPAALVSGRLDVNIGAASGTVPISDAAKINDNAAFTDGTSRLMPAGFIFDEVAGTALTENDAAAARVDSKRAQVHVIEDATTRGQRAAVSATGAVKTDSSATTQPISAAALPLPAGAATEASTTNGNQKTQVVDSTGANTAAIDAGGAVKVDNSGVTQPVSASSLPLPSGAATEGTLTNGNQRTRIVDAGGTNQAAVSAAGAVKVDNSGVTQPVSATTLPLPTGAATEATLAGNLKTKLVDAAGTNQAAISAAGAVKTDGSAVTQPVSDAGGSLTVDSPQLPPALVSSRLDVNIGASGITVPISASALPLPAGAATEATLAGNLKTKIVDAAGTNQAIVSTAGAVKTDGSAVTQPVSDAGGSLTVDNAGTFAVQDSQTIVDNAAFTDGTSRVRPAGYIFDEVAGTALTENDVAAARVDAKRAQVHVIEDGTTRGQRAAVSATGAVKVDGSAVTQPVSDAGGSLTVDSPQLPAALVNSNLATHLGTAAMGYGRTLNYYTVINIGNATTTIAAAVAGQRHKVVGWVLSTPGGTVRFRSAANNISGDIEWGFGTPVVVPPNPLAPLFQTNVNESLNIVTAGQGGGDSYEGVIIYITEA